VDLIKNFAKTEHTNVFVKLPSVMELPLSSSFEEMLIQVWSIFSISFFFCFQCYIHEFLHELTKSQL